MLRESRPAGVVAHVPPAVVHDRVVLFASGKGGVGTSVAASLFALACSVAGKRVLLIDGHEGNGALHHLFGVRPVRSLDALRDHTVEIADVLIVLGDHFSLVTS
jgi:MinD-like ATPase involved in chromosome partitioning or flagellar assembly